MKKILSKSQWLIARHGISLVAVFAMLVVAFIAIAPNLSFGWFSQNNEVSANGMTVQASHPDFDVFYRQKGSTEWTLIDLSSASVIAVTENLRAPGATSTFEIMIENKSQRALVLNGFGIATPTAAEEATNAAGVHLSTELLTTLVSVGRYNETANAVEAISGVSVNNAPVLTLPEEGVTALNVDLRKGNDTAESGQVNYMAYVTDQSVTLPSEGNVVFEVSIHFVNREQPQNDFKNFGVNDDGVCQRRLYFTYSEP